MAAALPGDPSAPRHGPTNASSPVGGRHLLLLQDGLDALALVGAEGDGGFLRAQHLLHLPLLIVLLHGDLECQNTGTWLWLAAR